MEDNNLDVFYGDTVVELEDQIKFELKREEGMCCTRFGGGSLHNPTKITSIEIYVNDVLIRDWKVATLINIRPHEMDEYMCDALRRKLGKLFGGTVAEVEKECIRYNQYHWSSYD